MPAMSYTDPEIALINTARGSLVDLDALHQALKAGRIGAAGLDVLGKEPADPSHPLIAAWRSGARYDALMNRADINGWH